MSDWEFLLQKEGDQTWLPLESADVEILEGRYRIVASTHTANTEVQIRIIHYSTEEIPPVKRVQKRSSHTHSQGLIAIIPFTSLKPGKWEFRCQAEVTTSSVIPKQYIVHLEVLPIEYEVSDYTQQLDAETQTKYLPPDSQDQQNTDFITDENILTFPGQLDIDEVEIKGEKNIEKNIADSAQLAQRKLGEIKLFDSLSQDKLAETENIVDLPRIDDRKDANIFGQNKSEKPSQISTQSKMMPWETEASKENKEENELIENQKIELPKIPENQLTAPVKVNQETETKSEEKTQTDAIAKDRLPLQLTLDQASYIAEPGEALIISGQVMPDIKTQPSKPVAGFDKIHQTYSTKTKTDDVAINYPPVVNGNLQICLRNPQTSEVLIEIQQTLPDQEPPIIFACTIHVPENIQSRLVLGQINLKDETGILASKSFTITAPLQEWLEAIDDKFVEDQHQTASLESIKPDRKPPSFQELVANINQTHSQTKSDADRPLPPQIYKPIEGGSDSESLDLPAFGNPLPENLAKGTPKINDLLAKSESPKKDGDQVDKKELNENELDDVWEDANSPPEQTKLQAETTESESETTENEEAPNIKQNLVPFPTKFAPRNKAFKALKLEDRFFSRLNSLINDSELSQWMTASSSPSPPTEETETSTELDKSPELNKKQAEAGSLEDIDPMSTIANDVEFADENFAGKIDWEAQEFVVEDELHEQLFGDRDQQSSTGLANILPHSEESIDTQPYILPDEQPIPVPHLEVLAKDVIAGRQIKVRVQLPDSLPRIYVKLWVYDRQAQTIVAGPRWLTDFIPNGMGQLETIADLEIAYGCLEIKFEAIAVEMQTNRESHKAVVERLVIPPPPPSLPFDNLS
ncbi:MAG: hypothetical protein WBA93_07920 [Microcoleaceae cyanobacterium]